MQKVAAKLMARKHCGSFREKIGIFFEKNCKTIFYWGMRMSWQAT